MRWPSTSTMHCRQAPTGSSSGWSQNRGIWMPSSSAARMTSVPLGTDDLEAVDGQGDQVDRTGGFPPAGRRVVVTVIRRPLPRRRWRRPGRTGSRGRSKCATYSSRKYWIDEVIGLVAPSPRAQNDRPKMLSQVSSRVVEVLLGAVAALEPLEDLHHPVGALAARRALAARLVRVELGPAQHRAHDAGGLVEALQRLGAEHRAGRADALEVQRHVEVLGGEQRRGRAAGRPELQLVALAHAAGQVEQLAQRDAERRLVLAGAFSRGRTASRA